MSKFSELLDQKGTHLTRFGNLLTKFMKNQMDMANMFNKIAPFFPKEFGPPAIDINRKGIELLDEFREANKDLIIDTEKEMEILSEILNALNKQSDR